MSDFIEDPVIENDDVNDIHQDSTVEQQNSLVANSEGHADQAIVDSDDNISVVGSDDNTNVVNQPGNNPSFGHRLTTVAVENENPHQVSFGSKEEDNAWNEKQAAHAFEQENWHLEQAKKAAERGDFSSAKDHRSTADSWHSTGKDYANKVKR